MHVHLCVRLPVVGELEGKPDRDEIVVLEFKHHAALARSGTDRGNRGLHSEAAVRRRDGHASVRKIQRMRLSHDVARGFDDDDIVDIQVRRERT